MFFTLENVGIECRGTYVEKMVMNTSVFYKKNGFSGRHLNDLKIRLVIIENP